MNKKILVIFVIFSVFISISAVSADDAADDIDTYSSTGELSGSDALSAEEDDTSFDALNTRINSGTNVIDLFMDYTFNERSDWDYVNGISIERDGIVINGNNHTIDAKGQARIFNINASNIIIRDLILTNTNDSSIVNYGELKTVNVGFHNGSSNYGAAVYVENGEYTSENDMFINNFADYGAAISSSSSSIYVNNGYFDDNIAGKGTVIYSDSDNITVKNSLLSNNFNSWGLLFLSNSTVYIANTSFVNTTSRYAAAVYGERCIVNITNSSFINLYSNFTAGAMAFKESNEIAIEYCKFINCTSVKNGGAIFIDFAGMSGEGTGGILIQDTCFENCFSGFGGAYLQLGGESSISNSNFTGNCAEFTGGAVYTSTARALFENCIFRENKALEIYEGYPSYGGAVYSDNTDLKLYNCEFINNSAVEGSAVYIYDSAYELNNLVFNGNENAIYTVFDRSSKVTNIKGKDEISDDDFNNTLYDDCVSKPGMQIELLNSTVNITSIPERYDLRDEGLVTPVKDQGSMGACWTFGITAALESALLKSMNFAADFSEKNMQNSMIRYALHGDTEISEGGETIDGFAYLLSWFGAFPNDLDSYDELGKISPLIQTNDDIHVQDVIIVPHDPYDEKSRNDVKIAILKYGALASTILSKATQSDGSSTRYFNENTSAEYVPENLTTNHIVCVVGWDDNYSASNFVITPPGDGAWIVKNSWGTDWGDEGYFYVSYYDRTLAANPNKISECFVAFPFENAIEYTKNYQFDFAGILNGFYKTDDPVSYYNIFYSYDDDLIAAVGTYFEKEGVEYRVDIEVNDIPVYSQTGVSPYYGYHTIQLDKYIPIKKGDKFIAQITTDAAPLCSYARTYFKPNSSYIIYPNGEHDDLGAKNIAACLKVYTVSKLDTELEVPDVAAITHVTGSVVATLKDVYGDVISGVNVKITVGNLAKTLKTDENGQVSLDIISLAPGEYTVNIKSAATEIYNRATATATATVIDGKFNTILTVPDAVAVSNVAGSVVATFSDVYGNVISGVNVKITVGSLAKTLRSDDDGQVSLDISSLAPGNYTVNVKTATTDIYNRATATAKAIVSEDKVNTVLDVYNTVAIAGNASVIATLSDEYGNAVSGVNVKITVGSLAKTLRSDDDGQVSLDISSLAPGEYTVNVKTATTDVFNRATTTAKAFISAEKVNTTLTVANVVKIYNTPGSVVATLTDVYGNMLSGVNVKITVGSLAKTLRSDDDGQVSLDITSLAPGEYTVNVKSATTDVFNRATATAKVFVSADKINTVLTVPDVATVVGRGNIVATFKDIYGNVISGVNVKITVGSLAKTLKTDANGQVSLDISSLAVGNYTVSVKTATTDIYNRATATAKLFVSADKIDTVLTADNVVIAQGSGDKFVATLKDVLGNPVSGVNVKITVGSLAKTLKTDANGQVALDVSTLAPGSYTANIKAATTDVYERAAAISAKVKITK